MNTPILRRQPLLVLGLACAAVHAAAQSPRAVPPAGTVATTASASSGSASTAVYQQRLPDGRVVLTDRPARPGVTERRWEFESENPARAAAAAARRQAASQEAAQVNERIQRAIEHQQRLQRDLEIERLRRDQALAELQAERERAARAQSDTTQGPLIVVPGWHRPHVPPLPGTGPRPWEPPVVPPPVHGLRERPAPLRVDPPAR